MGVQSTRAEEERAADAGLDQPLRFVPAPRILDILHHGDEVLQVGDGDLCARWSVNVVSALEHESIMP